MPKTMPIPIHLYLPYIQGDWKVTPDFKFYVMQSNMRLQILRKVCGDKHKCITIRNVFDNNEEYMKS